MIPFFIVSLLLSTTSQLIFSAAEKPYNPLNHAITIQSIDKIKSLLRARAPICSQDPEGQSPLDRAYQVGNPEIVNLLFQAGSGLTLSEKTKEAINSANKQSLACITQTHLTYLEKKAVQDSFQFKNSIGNLLFGPFSATASPVLIHLWQGGDFNDYTRILAKRPLGYQCNPEGFKAAAKSDASDLYLTQKLLHLEKQTHLREEFLKKHPVAVTDKS